MMRPHPVVGESIRVSLPRVAWMWLAFASVLFGAIGYATAGPDGARTPAVEHAPDQVEHDWVTDYVIVRVAPDVEPVQNQNGRWSFGLNPGATAWMPAQAARAVKQSARQAQRELRKAMNEASVVDVRAMGGRAARHAALASSHRLDRYYRVALPPGMSVADATALAAALEAQPALIEAAQLDAWGTTAGGLIPDDPDFDMLYGLHDTIAPFADIDAPEAWTISTGAPQMILAVLDSGVSAHPELTGRMVPGHNSVLDNAETSDSCNHGTHCAGTAAATANNSIGIAGVNWRVRIMPVRVLTGCTGTEADLADGLVWATDNGAHVANMSLQYTAGTDYLHDAILYARAAGVALYAAAGNFGTSGGVAFPGRWPETTTLAATDDDDEHWTFSNDGPEVTVAAPGVNIWSLSNTGSFMSSTGSSMATAHASGVACLMRAIDPTITHDEMQQILIDTANDVETPGFDELTGHGRINAHAALQATLERLGIPGDVNADESVNEADRDALLALLGTEWGEPGFLARADLNHDGTIDTADEALLNDLISTCPADFVDSQTFEPPGDGQVGGADLAYLLGEWGANPESLADIVTTATFEPPPDGLVDGADLAFLLSGWGACGSD